MDNPNSSPLDTLRQLKEMLDAGALTPTEFEALKQRLVFHYGATPAPPVAPASAEPAPEAPVVLPARPALETPSPMFEDLAPAGLAPTPPAPGPVVPAAETIPPEEEPAFIPPAVRRALEADAPVAPPLPPLPTPSPGLAAADSGYVADEFPEGAAPAARSPLALILSIGGLLALLGLVMYLSLNRQPSERLSSTSLTPADTVTTAIETGPQAEQMTPLAAAPETIRVAPTNPAPALPSRSAMEKAAAAARDSAAAVAPAVSDSAAGQ